MGKIFMRDGVSLSILLLTSVMINLNHFHSLISIIMAGFLRSELVVVGSRIHLMRCHIERFKNAL